MLSLATFMQALRCFEVVMKSLTLKTEIQRYVSCRKQSGHTPRAWEMMKLTEMRAIGECKQVGNDDMSRTCNLSIEKLYL